MTAAARRKVAAQGLMLLFVRGRYPVLAWRYEQSKEFPLEARSLSLVDIFADKRRRLRHLWVCLRFRISDDRSCGDEGAAAYRRQKRDC